MCTLLLCSFPWLCIFWHHLLSYHPFPLSCFLQNQLYPLLCTVSYPQRNEVCYSFSANLPCSHHHAFQRSQSVSRWLALLWIQQTKVFPRSDLALVAKTAGETSHLWDKHTLLLWVNPGQQLRATQPPSSRGIGHKIRMVEVRKLLSWEERSLIWKAKAVCTSKAKQGSYPLFSINRQVYSYSSRKVGLHHTQLLLQKK